MVQCNRFSYSLRVPKLFFLWNPENELTEEKRNPSRASISVWLPLARNTAIAWPQGPWSMLATALPPKAKGAENEEPIDPDETSAPREPEYKTRNRLQVLTSI